MEERSLILDAIRASGGKMDMRALHKAACRTMPPARFYRAVHAMQQDGTVALASRVVEMSAR
jgi:transposase